MAAYATAMRIERIEIRGRLSARRAGLPRRSAEPQATPTVIELSGTNPGQRLRERLDDLRVYLGQLTWYLFNAEGWR
jgi:hypothetical protein